MNADRTALAKKILNSFARIARRRRRALFSRNAVSQESKSLSWAAMVNMLLSL
jgi:hypothetical protein